jgi:large subunit ribosomal protein L14e
MSIYSVGRICLKLAGRDAGRKCVIVNVVDDKFVTIDGNVRRKNVNTKHLEPLKEVIQIKDNASHAEVKIVFEKLGLTVWDKKSKTPTERPKQVRKTKEKPVVEKSKRITKKAVKKEESVEKVEKTGSVEDALEPTVEESPKVEQKPEVKAESKKEEVKTEEKPTEETKKQ